MSAGWRLAEHGTPVTVLERDDLATGASSATSHMLHGGLRYLEHYEFRLVREALHEREILLAKAPHIIWPLRFVLPHHAGLRPAWLLRLGLFLYDHIGARNRLPATETIRLDRHPAGVALKPEFKHGFVYSDGWVDDARLVVANAFDARARGARIRILSHRSPNGRLSPRSRRIASHRIAHRSTVARSATRA